MRRRKGLIPPGIRGVSGLLSAARPSTAPAGAPRAQTSADFDGGMQNRKLEAAVDHDEQDDPEAPVRIPIEDVIDLHAFAPRDVPNVVTDYLDAAREAGWRDVRLVHGRGIGVQRAAVHALLARHPGVERFWDAPEAHLGATIVRLKPSGS